MALKVSRQILDVATKVLSDRSFDASADKSPSALPPGSLDDSKVESEGMAVKSPGIKLSIDDDANY
jgi:hypothetical protein